MTEREFWKIIDESRSAMKEDRNGNFERQARKLRELLLPLEPSEIVSFRDHFHHFVTDAYNYDLWAVAYIVGDGCSDDWFDYFRFWLVSLGQERYSRALASPESVDSLFRETRAEDFFFEEISYVPGRVYREKTGSDIPYPEGSGRQKVKGRRWKTDDELVKRYPALCEKYWR